MNPKDLRKMRREIQAKYDSVLKMRKEAEARLERINIMLRHYDRKRTDLHAEILANVRKGIA